MNSQYVIEIKNRGWRVTFSPLPFVHQFSVGGEGADIPVPGCPHTTMLVVRSMDGVISLHAQNAIIRESATTDAGFADGSDAHFHIVDEEAKQEFVSLVFHANAQKKAPEYNMRIEVPDNKRIICSPDHNADMIVRHPMLKAGSIALHRTGDIWHIEARGTIPMGLHLNATKVASVATAHAGAFVDCVGMHLYLGESYILATDDHNLLVRNLYYERVSEGEHHLKYPCINRAARIMNQVPTDEFQVQDPPAAPSENRGNLVISLLPAVAMILLTVFLRGNYASSIQMMLFSTLSLSIGAVSSILTYVYTGNQQKKQSKTRRDRYLAYIEQCRKQLTSIRADEKYILNDLYYNSDTQIQQVEAFSACLFDRRPSDTDFLDIRLGYGRKLSQQGVAYKAHDSFEAMDELYQMPAELAREFAYIDDMPVCVKGREASAIGIVGDTTQLKRYLNVLTLDLATRHYFEDIRIHFLLSETYYDEMYAWRLLPHARSQESFRRNISFNQESRTSQLETLYKELEARHNAKGSIEEIPWLVIFVDAGQQMAMQHPLFKYVPDSAQVHVLFVFLSMFQDLLPQGCTSIVQLMNNANAGIISVCSGNSADLLFSYQLVDNQAACQVATKLAPVFSWETKLATHLTGNETLFDMLQISAASELDITARWRNANTTISLAAPLGICDDGSVLQLDLHENAHGPHGLMAGMTGSGKSQVLISYLLALAATYSPEDIAFAVIDFKGGDIVKQLAGLPHIVGSITNIAKNEIDRSLRSINAEKNKRMILFDEEHANVSNIFEYTKAYKAGKANTPLPHLLIIVDEFAELKSQYPDFMQELISIARVGRSLGIHLILCTQKPAGVVDGQIWSNSNFHLCLRVQNHEDSNEVLHSPLAAEIREPGRGYLQVEHQMFELFQSGYSGTAETKAVSRRESAWTVKQLDIAGFAETIYEHKTPVSTAARTQRDALLEMIIRAFEDSGMRYPESLCMPPIPETLMYDENAKASIFELPVGIYDDPDKQAVHPLTIDISGRNTLIVGGSQMGKTNLLLSIIRRVCSSMSATDCAIYAMDFNAKAIKAMESLCLLGGVVTDDEEEKLKSLLRMVKEEIGQRKVWFAQKGVRTFAAYHEMFHDLPAIIVMIDNYAVFHDLYEETYGDELLILLREGPTYGISFIVTVQQIATLTYKKPYYFTQRIVLPLSEQMEYSTVLDNCRTTLPDIPGRVLIQIDKKIYQGQTYEAFTGKNETESARAIRTFVQEHATGVRVRGLPHVPDVLTEQYLRETCSDKFIPGMIPCAMEYDTVQPMCIDMNANGMIAIVGNDENHRCQFTKLLIRRILAMKLKLYVLDSYYRPLKEFRNTPGITRYSTSEADLDALFTQLESKLQAIDSQADYDAIEQPACTVVLLNSYEYIKYISGNMMLMEQFKSFMENARKLNVFFIFSDVPNKPANYSTPELFQYIGGEKQAIVFSALSTLKVFSVDFATIREHSRALAPDEAFFMSGDDITRVKMCTD